MLRDSFGLTFLRDFVAITVGCMIAAAPVTLQFEGYAAAMGVMLGGWVVGPPLSFLMRANGWRTPWHALLIGLSLGVGVLGFYRVFDGGGSGHRLGINALLAVIVMAWVAVAGPFRWRKPLRTILAVLALVLCGVGLVVVSTKPSPKIWTAPALGVVATAFAWLALKAQSVPLRRTTPGNVARTARSAAALTLVAGGSLVMLADRLVCPYHGVFPNIPAIRSFSGLPPA